MKNTLSHENFLPSFFKPHGQVKVWPEGNVVFLDLTGPFNREFFSSLLVLNDTLYSELRGNGPFVEIALFRESMLMPQDALAEFGSILLKRSECNISPLATAWVIGEEITESIIMLPLFKKKFAEAARPFEVFNSLDDANAWVRELLLSTNSRRY